jgi:hypothetical protein
LEEGEGGALAAEPIQPWSWSELAPGKITAGSLRTAYPFKKRGNNIDKPGGLGIGNGRGVKWEANLYPSLWQGLRVTLAYGPTMFSVLQSP